jgi:hypothetical protein
MQHEYDPLMSNGTWELVDLPKDRAIIIIIWIYKSSMTLTGMISVPKLDLSPKGAVNRPASISRRRSPTSS